MSTTLLFALMFAFAPLSSQRVAAAADEAAAYDALVVIHIAALDDASLARLSKQVGRDKSVSVEYSCVWSGVVVLKFSNIAVGERADVIQLARRQLTAAGIEQGVEFLHVHAEERGTGKC